MPKKKVVNTPEQFEKAIKVSLDELTEVSESSVQQATFAVSQEFLKDGNYYAPMDVGTLRKSGVLNSNFKKGLVIWKTPYVRRLWFGIAFNFSKDSNPYARAKWGEYAERKHNKKYKNMYNKIFDKGWD